VITTRASTDEFKRWAHKKDWKLRMSATYKQRQNAVAEALWAKLKPMTSINISSNPELGYQWWDRAMVHANHTAQYWPCKANPGTATPMDRWTGTAITPQHTSNLGGHVGTYTNRYRRYSPEGCEMLLPRVLEVSRARHLRHVVPIHESRAIRHRQRDFRNTKDGWVRCCQRSG
jgi:hypothetical protein